MNYCLIRPHDVIHAARITTHEAKTHGAFFGEGLIDRQAGALHIFRAWGPLIPIEEDET